MSQRCLRSEDLTVHSRTGLLSELEKHGEYNTESVPGRVSRTTVIPWLLNVVLLIVIAIQSVLLFKRSCNPYWGLSEFVTVKKEIPATLKQVQYTAGLQFNESQDLYRTLHPGTPQYVGEPTPELDAAWSDLIGAINVFVKPSEEASLGGGLYLQPESELYMAQVTVFHDLHCLNMLRQNLPFYNAYYDQGDSTRPHIDHCIDSLRLSLMCSGDMTLSPMVWSEEKGRIIPNFEVQHTCRDYEALKEWANARDSSDESKYPANAARLHAEGD